jgi:hypothetical protein
MRFVGGWKLAAKNKAFKAHIRFLAEICRYHRNRWRFTQSIRRLNGIQRTVFLIENVTE